MFLKKSNIITAFLFCFITQAYSKNFVYIIPDENQIESVLSFKSLLEPIITSEDFLVMEWNNTPFINKKAELFLKTIQNALSDESYSEPLTPRPSPSCIEHNEDPLDQQGNSIQQGCITSSSSNQLNPPEADIIKRAIRENLFYQSTSNDMTEFYSEFTAILTSKYLSHKRIIAAILLAFEILMQKQKTPDINIQIIGFGVQGSQIAHLTSNLLTPPTTKSTTVPLTMLWMIVEPILPALGLSGMAVAAIIESLQLGVAITKATHQMLVERCKNMIGFDPVFLDKTVNILSSIKSNGILIENVFTLGSSFRIEGSLPNMHTIKKYWNFYSLSDRETFGSNYLDLEKIARKSKFIKQKYAGNHLKTAQSKITQINVEFKNKYIPCCELSIHEQLINSGAIINCISNLIKQNNKPMSSNEYKMKVISDTESESSAMNRNSIGNKLKRFFFYLFSCGCCYK